MFGMSRRDTVLRALLTAAIVAVATPSFAQGASEAQKAAVKSACRSDYMAHCSSVQPGGEAALQCLAKNMSSLSPSCQSAVRTIEASVAPKSEPATTEAAPAAAPKTETTTAQPAAEPKGESKPAATMAKKPTSAQVSAIRSACRGDYPKVCAGVPTGGAPALECLEKNKARVSAACGKALAAADGGTDRAGHEQYAGSSSGRTCGCSGCDRAAADGAARRAVRAALGLRRRRPHAVRRCRARRRPHHAVHFQSRGRFVPGLQRGARAVRRALSALLGGRLAATDHSPRNARMSWTIRTDSAM